MDIKKRTNETGKKMKAEDGCTHLLLVLSKHILLLIVLFDASLSIRAIATSKVFGASFFIHLC